MPLTLKGKKILKQMKKTYKTTEKSKEILYAMIEEGKITGAEKKKKKK